LTNPYDCRADCGSFSQSGDIKVLDMVAAIMLAAEVSPSTPSVKSTRMDGSPSSSDASHTRDQEQSLRKATSTSEVELAVSLAQLCVPFVQASAFFEEFESFTGR